MTRKLVWLASWLAVFATSACTSSAPAGSQFPAHSPLQSKAPEGFWDRLADQLTERECNVYRFTCPYGWGPAGEPCECTDPAGGIVRRGVTIK